MKQLKTKEESIKQVAENHPEYYSLSLDLARRWVSEQFKIFSSEDFRNHCELVLGISNEPRVFGAVFKALIEEKRLSVYGTSTAKNKQAHGRLIRTYISREYSLKQSKNARKEQTLNLFENGE
ncbi:hypothetical protein D3C85_896240 [compost metagenome]